MPKVTPSKETPSRRNWDASTANPLRTRTTAKTVRTAPTDRISSTSPSRVESLIPATAKAPATTAAAPKTASWAPVESPGTPIVVRKLPR